MALDLCTMLFWLNGNDRYSHQAIKRELGKYEVVDERFIVLAPNNVRSRESTGKP